MFWIKQGKIYSFFARYNETCLYNDKLIDIL